ncbi:hypothetical protein NM208_g6330 [Fusarium decemcellulare]|uniref:Uncharacterized protein n=1 Tax=Fusarium decemcellulare TaxID=57161 RepID=A0ACC1SDP8_9HYPO|nr:hypothetical protein NM208_g6330 [Fusarium decemcellulare]
MPRDLIVGQSSAEPAADEHWDDINWVLERHAAIWGHKGSDIKPVARAWMKEAFESFERGQFHLGFQLYHLDGKLRKEWERRKGITTATQPETASRGGKRKATEDIRPADKAKKAAPKGKKVAKATAAPKTDAPARLSPLSTKNLWGSYKLECPYVREEWPRCSSRAPFELTIALGVRSMWATFELGIYEGIMHFDQVPERASHDPIWFTWRGEEQFGLLINGDSNRGWLKFLGGGRIEGWLDHQSISFTGVRDPGQNLDEGDIPERTAMCLRLEWEDFSGEGRSPMQATELSDEEAWELCG